MGPINYSLDVETPFQAALQGYKGGAAIREDQFAVQQRQQAMAAEQQARQQMAADLSALTSNPSASARDYAAFTLKYPQLKDQVKQGFEMISGEKRAGKLDLMSRAYAAISSGRPEVASQIIRQSTEAMRESGVPEQEIQAQEMWAKLIETSPDQAKHMGGLMLSSLMEPDKFASTFGALGTEGRAAAMAPADLAKARADAAKAAAEAEFQPTKQRLEAENTQSQIDDRREGQRIRAMELALSRETNEIKRQDLQLRINEAKSKIEGAQRERVAEAASSLANFDRSLQTIDSILSHPVLTEWDEAGTGAITSALSIVPGTDSYDFKTLVETLQSQSFMAEIEKMKGLGALSEAEGKKVAAAVANLSLGQSTKSFKKAVETARGIFEDGRKRAYSKYGPAAENIVVIPKHPQFGDVTEGVVQQLMSLKKMSRADALEFLNATGAAGGASSGGVTGAY